MCHSTQIRLPVLPTRAAPLGILALVAAVLLVEQSLADDLLLHKRTRVHLASVQEAAETLGQEDTFVRQMGPLERQLRLAADAPVSTAQYLAFARRQTVAWTPEDVRRVTQAITALQAKLVRLKDVFPDRVDLIKTTGREENNAPHCRGNAIILPAGSVEQEVPEIEKLLAHELFHILSRNSPQLRTELYAVVGFQSVPPIELPEPWRDRRITNPDAPEINCVIRLEHESETLHLTPILLTREANYSNLSHRSLFHELTFRLMPVEARDGRWMPTEAARQGQSWQAEQLPEYARRIGRNTRYIIHPEEILADNFVHLVADTPNLPDPWVTQRLGELLRQP